MKIEVASWIKDYAVDVDNIYTELSHIIEKDTSSGFKQRELQDYQQLFQRRVENPDHRAEGQKILLVADPGYGKTSLSKKILSDWAKGKFRTFTLVFLVYLKKVRSGDFIENIIIQQTPGLEGMGVSLQKLRQILHTFTNKCLIILEGLDEHALGSNEDVLGLIAGEKLPQSSIITTSRLHCIHDIKGYFQTIVKTKGFTNDAAKQFAQQILEDPDKEKTALNLGVLPQLEQTSSHFCPIILSFKCILVRDEDISSTKKAMFLDDIYAKMIRCQYKAFTRRKGIPYQATDFLDVIQKIGKVAFETLISGNSDLQRSNIIRKIGGDAFNYGLIIGHEKHTSSEGRAGDIHVTFLEKGIQYFLGAFYFMQMLSSGENLQGVSGHGNITLTTNTIFLHFCL